jgi:heme-degrading monooxygenase HmoA
MYARVSRYRGDPELIVDVMSEPDNPELESLSGFGGLWTLADRETGDAISITLWDSEQAMLDSVEAANRLRNETNRDAGGLDAPIVEMYEVLLKPEVSKVSSRQGTGLFARVSKYMGDPDLIAEVMSEPGPAELDELPGYKGVWTLVDRETGRAMSITLWENEEVMLDSVEVANRLRNEANRDAGGLEPPVVEMYEVLLQVETMPETSR